jgi:hypothetical protein
MKVPEGVEYDYRAGQVPGAELIAAYMSLHPGWTCRGVDDDANAIGATWIETWEGKVVASASYTKDQSKALGLRGLMYARTFVAVSVAEGFAMLAGTA